MKVADSRSLNSILYHLYKPSDIITPTEKELVSGVVLKTFVFQQAGVEWHCLFFLNLNPYLTRLVSLRYIFQERPGEEGSNVTGSQTIELITSNCIDPASGSSLVTAPQESEGKKVTDEKTTR